MTKFEPELKALYDHITSKASYLKGQVPRRMGYMRKHVRTHEVDFSEYPFVTYPLAWRLVQCCDC